ncbi:uncharacterized protein N7469_011534 [Penicillium citrinum]|uniref:Uncharacterized protein n=2 Tax=Penicillium TaxID=5073 RepID=A0A9W9NCZ8_PENCI|nr:uncharacterized protein N7469_011534 [Penicillium citrinum]KAJ5216669.1 hypothetical protein N7469_011534 [Penicillium citrinum]KAJ5600984.1 hypothetical protein N7450_002051 [Penicillium hetheringtonii]
MTPWRKLNIEAPKNPCKDEPDFHVRHAMALSFSHRSGMNSSGLEKFDGDLEVAHDGTATVVCEFVNSYHRKDTSKT